MLLDVADLRIAIGDAKPVDGLSFSLDQGQRLGIVGDSGSGKSLVALAIAQRARGDDDLLDLAFADGLLVIGRAEGRVEGEQERAGEQRTLDIHKFLQPQADG